MSILQADDPTLPIAHLAQARMPVVVERTDSSLTFHVGRNPEFLQGVKDGRQLLPTDWDLTGKNAWWEVEDVLQFVQRELHSASLAKENEVRECFEAPPRTPIYNLGLVAGLLTVFAEAALRSSQESSEEASGGNHEKRGSSSFGLSDLSA